MAGVRERVVPAVACLVLLAAGLGTRGLELAGADTLGDALYAAFVLAGLWLLAPAARAAVLGGLALTWCVAVELLQLTGVPDAAAARVPLSRLVLGAGFDPLDLLAYAVGVGLGVVALRRRRPGRRRAG